MSKVTDDKLNFWMNEKLNVLFIGKHGVGKTGMVKTALDRKYGAGNWRYFSAATMDAWVDFIGVPKEVEDEHGSHLELIKPKEFRDDTVKAIFFDEYNRAPKKVTNAVMELIQFKSINGRPYNNLELVWAAINPKEEDEIELDYHVEEMDPAQMDRFHIHVHVPFDVSDQYFNDKFGVEHGQAACDWWRELPKKQKEAVSPRRLDYAIEIYRAGGEIREYVLPKESGVSNLVTTLKNGSPIQQLTKLVNTSDTSGVTRFCKDANNWASVKDAVVKTPNMYTAVFPYIRHEYLSTIVSETKAVERHVLQHPEIYRQVLEHLAGSAANFTIKNKAIKVLDNYEKESKNIPSTLVDILTSLIPKSHESTVRHVKKAGLAFNSTRIKDVQSSHVNDIIIKPADMNSQLYRIAHMALSGESSYDREEYLAKLAILVNCGMSEDHTWTALKVFDRFCARTQGQKLATNDAQIKPIFEVLIASLYSLPMDNKDKIARLFTDVPALISKYMKPHILRIKDQVIEFADKTDLPF